MPDNVGKINRIFTQQTPDFSQGSLIKFNKAQEEDKKINNRSTLDLNSSADAAKMQNEKAATDFEALLLQQMIQSMWKAVPSEGLLSGSSEEGMYRDMLAEQYAQELAQHQSMGLKDAVLGEMGRKK